MIKIYDLQKQGMNFKADFNWNFEPSQHLFQMRTKEGYFKIDIALEKRTKKFCLVRREADFVDNKAFLEVVNIG